MSSPSGSSIAEAPSSSSSSSAVHVVVRVRPQNDLEVKHNGQMAVEMTDTEIKVKNAVAGTTDGFNLFTFDRIFSPTSKQVHIFDEIGKPLIENVFEGYNGTIFAYGQTSSGKTYTMQGPDIMDDELAGIIPRTVASIFDNIAQASEDMEFTVRGSYVEIYLERIRDLLDTSRQNLQVREDPNKGIYVEGMSEQYVNSCGEMMELMAIGSNNRKQAATGMNEGSSRSHSVFVLQLVQTDTKNGTTKTSKVNLVDLAGSEVVRKTGATGERLDEAKMINLSLSALGKVINALTDGKSAHIPYRDSKLTRMLQESLGGNARTWLVINVSPSSYNAAETLNTLRFGNRAKAIQNKAVVNQVRSVEELELLLAQAERAIDIQAQYIEKLKSKVGSGGGSGSGNSSGNLPQRVVELELKVQELEQLHENDVQEQARSNAEIVILVQQLKEAKDELETTVETKESLITSLNEKLSTVSGDYTASQSKLEEVNSKYDHLEYQHKELNLTIATLQKENEKLNKELDSMPAASVSAAAATATTTTTTSGPTHVIDDDDVIASDGKDNLAALEANHEKQVLEWKAKQKEYENTIRELKHKLGSGVSLEESDEVKPASAIDPALEQRLYQLIAVHKQLLRKYAYAELAAAEKAQLLALKDERIRILEGNLKGKEFNFRAQAERHSLEMEELQLERQKELQELQLELAKARRELSESKSSFSAKAFSFIHKKARSPQGNRIVKPLRGGSSGAGNGNNEK